ncbi:hypothetical protein [Paenibacillus kandeliae]|uniref:hypothetical protein n=1 Tax=Paenibacillus kandeliae TaxID=3231269 RepID=UPI00345B23D6
MKPAATWIVPLYIATVVLTVPSPSYAATQPQTQLVASTHTHTSNMQSEQKRIAEQYDLHSAANHDGSSDYQPSYFMQIGDWGISTDNNAGGAIWRIAFALLQAL